MTSRKGLSFSMTMEIETRQPSCLSLGLPSEKQQWYYKPIKKISMTWQNLLQEIQHEYNDKNVFLLAHTYTSGINDDKIGNDKKQAKA